MNKTIWEWLGIEPTNDKNEIKKAYSEMAKIYHPVEHPEEFQMLRVAYKSALQMAEGRAKRPAVVKTYDFEEKPAEHSKPEPEYKFNVGIGDSYNFSERQMAMFSFYVDMLDVFKLHAQDYRSREYFESALKFWTKEPYKTEINADFISAVLDRLDMGCLFHPVFYKVLDEVLFAGKTGDDYQKQKIRLEAFRTETQLIKWKGAAKPFAKAIKKMFLQSMENATPVRLGLLFDEGISKKHPKKMLYFSKGVIFSVKRKVRFYLISDCTCKISKRTGDLTVRDVYGKRLFSMSTTHGYFHYVLRHLIEHGCKMVWAENKEIKSYTKEFDLDAALFHKLSFDGRFNRLAWFSYSRAAALLAVFVLQFMFVGFRRYLIVNGALGEIVYALLGVLDSLNNILLWVVGFWLFIFLIMSLVFTCQIIGNLFLYHKIQKECKSKKALHDLANRMFVFDSYVVVPHTRDFISLKTVTSLQPLRKNEPNGDGYIKIGFNNGAFGEYFVGYMDTAMLLYKEIKKRWDACEKEPAIQELTANEKQKMRLAKKYDRLSSKKKSLFKRQFLIDQDIKNQYDMNIIACVISVVYCFFVLYDYAFGKVQRSDVMYIVTAIGFICFVVLFIVKSDAVMSFMKTDNELLLNACLQLKRPGVYFNMLYNIRLLDDYFMSMRTGKIEIIPYKNIEWIKTEYSETKGHMLFIKEYGKEPNFFCNDQPNERNAKNVSEIFEMIKYLHPEIKIFTEEKAG